MFLRFVSARGEDIEFTLAHEVVDFLSIEGLAEGGGEGVILKHAAEASEDMEVVAVIMGAGHEEKIGEHAVGSAEADALRRQGDDQEGFLRVWRDELQPQLRKLGTDARTKVAAG